MFRLNPVVLIKVNHAVLGVRTFKRKRVRFFFLHFYIFTFYIFTHAIINKTRQDEREKENVGEFNCLRGAFFFEFLCVFSFSARFVCRTFAVHAALFVTDFYGPEQRNTLVRFKYFSREKRHVRGVESQAGRSANQRSPMLIDMRTKRHRATGEKLVFSRVFFRKLVFFACFYGECVKRENEAQREKRNSGRITTAADLQKS